MAGAETLGSVHLWERCSGLLHPVGLSIEYVGYLEGEGSKFTWNLATDILLYLPYELWSCHITPLYRQRCNHGKFFGATSTMVGSAPLPCCNRVKASENLGATTVTLVAPEVTSLWGVTNQDLLLLATLRYSQRVYNNFLWVCRFLAKNIVILF